MPFPAGISPNPSNGTPTVNVEGISGASNGEQVKSSEKLDYSNWNGDFLGFLQYIGEHGSDSDRDRWLNWLSTEESNKIAREWTEGREDTQYQRLVKDLKAAGINPYSLLTAGGQPVSSSSSGSSYNGSYGMSEALKKEANSQKWVSLITGILSTVIMAAVIMA